jgi:dihydrofolate synthase/folylpolyglutamate synthase
MPQVRPGLEHTEGALKEAGLLDRVQPQKVIHIAGTNGKGTTAKTLEQLLLSQNKKVGLYTSPHLVDTTERICINGAPISHAQFVSLCEDYFPLIEKWNLSHFESLTLFSAALFFAVDPVEYAIYEIGLGGTWDATNAIPHETSIIVTLGFDHQHILGNTLREIADNKFGIIQKQNKVFHVPYDDEITAQLEEKIKTTQSSRTCIAVPEVEIQKTTTLPIYQIEYQKNLYPLALPGLRAAQNMWLAVNIFAALGFSKIEGLKKLSQIAWPARMTELPVPTRCPVYLSGDHNLQGLESLKEILQNSSYKRLQIVFGLSKNRVHEDFITSLEGIPNMDLILTKPKFNGIEPQNAKHPYFEKALDALNFALNRAHPKDLIVVTGSLYLCGDILKQANEVHTENVACKHP